MMYIHTHRCIDTYMHTYMRMYGFRIVGFGSSLLNFKFGPAGSWMSGRGWSVSWTGTLAATSNAHKPFDMLPSYDIPHNKI